MSGNSAVIDATGRYRYALHRQWHEARRIPHGSVLGFDKSVVLWIMLNPSTADATQDDPTIRRCVGFSQAWGFDGLVVVNLFAVRATNPKALRLREDFYQSEHAALIGPENDATILREAERAPLIIAAWGNHGALYSRAEEVCELIGTEKVRHLGLTKMLQPRHPLYVRANQKPIQWVAASRPSEGER